MQDLPPNASLRQMALALTPLARNLVSDGYDAALDQLARQVPMTVHEFPTGAECFTWFIPEKWECDEARLETVSGEVIFSLEDSPLHVASYSTPFEGVVSRQELLEHCSVHPRNDEAIPFDYRYYSRNWGLCCSRKVLDSLQEDAYRVVIRSRFEPGSLKVGESVVNGSSGEEYVLCAHLCHPAMFNDGLSGVLAGVEAMRRLRARKEVRHTYRLVIVPETIGSAAWLSRHEHLIPRIKGGIFLEMLATKHNQMLQLSNFPESQLDQVCQAVLKERDPDSGTTGFLELVLNDERMFNSPGINVPMCSFSRAQTAEHGDRGFAGYHTHLDTCENADFEKYAESVETLMAMIDGLEANGVPVPLWKGELFCSRYPSIDYEAQFELISKVPYKMDGRRSVADIARDAGVGFSRVKSFLDCLEKEGLIRYAGDEEGRG